MHQREMIKRNAEWVYDDLLELCREFDIRDIPDTRLLSLVKKSDVIGMLTDMRIALDHIAESMFTPATNSGQIEMIINQLSDASDVLRKVEGKLSTLVEEHSMFIKNMWDDKKINVPTQMLNNRNRLREAILLAENFMEEHKGLH